MRLHLHCVLLRLDINAHTKHQKESVEENYGLADKNRDICSTALQRPARSHKKKVGNKLSTRKVLNEISCKPRQRNLT